MSLAPHPVAAFGGSRSIIDEQRFDTPSRHYRLPIARAQADTDMLRKVRLMRGPTGRAVFGT
jgi:hypothetical protein